ncbi:hypothetical protein LTR04_003289 [Oleoguttula sp. CCFEE 6159]|nr:hypothetical protein LTR04_003289 [Oleoguttula sp. CCFEE 6159]
MRPSAIIPVLCGIAALVLTLLCLFAGSSPNLMEGYDILTLNTSCFGQTLLNTTSTPSSSNPLTSLLHNISSSISSSVNADANFLARSLGLHDFYSAHLLDYCEGYYVPSPVANASLPLSAIAKNVTACSNRTVFFHFNPTDALQAKLSKTSPTLNLTALNWPLAIQDGLEALRVAQKAAFLLYCVAAGTILLSVITSTIAIFTHGRLSVFVEILLSTLAFLAITLASALTAAVADRATATVNTRAAGVGVQAQRGGKFLAITWAAVGCMGLAMFLRVGECCCGRRRERKRSLTAYAGGETGKVG